MTNFYYHVTICLLVALPKIDKQHQNICLHNIKHSVRIKLMRFYGGITMKEKSMSEFIEALNKLKKDNYKLFKTIKAQIDCINDIKDSN